MSAETRPDVEAIEHLDFVPKCEAKSVGCNGQNAADYLVVTMTPHCIPSFFICSGCIQRKVSLGPRWWRCGKCFALETRRYGHWLEGVTLHPLGDAA